MGVTGQRLALALELGTGFSAMTFALWLAWRFGADSGFRVITFAAHLRGGTRLARAPKPEDEDVEQYEEEDDKRSSKERGQCVACPGRCPLGLGC